MEGRYFNIPGMPGRSIILTAIEGEHCMDIQTGKWRIFLTAVLIAAVMLISGYGTQKPVAVLASAS